MGNCHDGRVMAKSIQVAIKVISSSTNPDGQFTAYEIDNTDGVRQPHQTIVVGYERVTGHYVGAQHVLQI